MFWQRWEILISGKFLKQQVAEASKFAIDRPLLSCGGNMTITNEDFEAALAEVSPSLSAEVPLVCFYVFLFYLLCSSPHAFDILGPGTQEVGATC